MRFFVFSLVMILTPLRLAAFEIEERLVLGGEVPTLKIISTTDIDIFHPVLESFLAAHPDQAIEYVVTSSSEIMTALVEDSVEFDVAISSAMDLQTKLANDGLTIAHSSIETSALPDWAHWRQDIFAFTQEPAAIVLSKVAFDELEMPATREDLISLMRSHPDVFRGRVGTYDLRQSGLGYLFATQDSRMSEVYWRLTEVMGALDTQLYSSSGRMIDDVAAGKLAVAYNVLGSYALSREDQDTYIVLLPEDFTTVMQRTALIPASAQNVSGAGEFIDYLLRVSVGMSDSSASLGSLYVDLSEAENALRRIRLGPSLLIFLDSYKRRRFLSAWENSILQE